MVVSSLNLEASLIRARFEFDSDLDSYLLSMVCLSEISTAVVFFIVNMNMHLFEEWFLLNPTQIRAMFLYLFFYPPVVLFQNAERFKYKYKWTVAISMAVSLGASALSVLFVVTWEDKLAGRIAGYLIPVTVIGIIVIIYYIVKGKKVKTAYWKYALPFSLPFIPHLLSMFLLGSMDKAMIKSICGSEDLALYSLSYTIGSLITILVNSMNGAFSPWLGEQLSQKNYSSIKKVSVPYVLCFAYCALGLVLITPEVLLLMGGEAYMEAKYVMPPVTAGCLMQFVYCLYVNVEQYEKKTIGMAIASVIAAVFNYVTNYVFIRMYGYQAAAYTTFFGYFFLLIMHMYLVFRIGHSSLYDNKKILSISIITSSLMFMSGLLFEHNIIRYCIIGLYIGVGVWMISRYKDAIKTLLKKRKGG